MIEILYFYILLYFNFIIKIIWFNLYIFYNYIIFNYTTKIILNFLKNYFKFIKMIIYCLCIILYYFKLIY